MNTTNNIIMFARWKIKNFSSYIITTGNEIHRIPYNKNGRFNSWHKVRGHEAQGMIYYNLKNDQGKFTRLSEGQIKERCYLHEKEYDTNILKPGNAPF